MTNYVQGTVYNIQMPRGYAWRPDLAQALMNRLATSGEIVLRIHASYQSMKWQVVDISSYGQGQVIEGAIRSVYPDAVIKREEYKGEPFVQPFTRHIMPYILSKEFIGPLAYVDQLRFDPILMLSNLLGELLPNECVSYNIFLERPNPKWNKEAMSGLKRSWYWRLLPFLDLNFSFKGLWSSFISAFHLPDQRFTKDLQKIVEEKGKSNLIGSFLAIHMDVADENRAYRFSYGIDSSMKEFASEYQSLLRYLPEKLSKQLHAQSVTTQEQADATNIYRLFREAMTEQRTSPLRKHLNELRLITNSSELASLWHLPNDEYTAPTIERVQANYVRVPAQLRQEKEGALVGENKFAGIKTDIRIQEVDRSEHMLIVGRTRQGKSTLMHQLIAHDIRKGRGVAVLDPDGTLVSEILQTSIPPEREKDVVVWDLCNDNPPPMNPLVVKDKVNRHAVAVRFQDIYGRYEPEFTRTRMSSNLSDVLQTIMEIPQGTIRDVRKLMIDTKYRNQFIESLDDDAAYEFWVDYDNMGIGERREMREPLMHRFRQLYRGETLDSILCHPQSLDFDTLISENKIILISLQSSEKAMVSQEQKELLGAILVSQFEVAASANAAKSPFHVYVDEADLFVTTSLPQMFKRASKRNMYLTLATQHLDSLAGNVLDAVVGNVGAIVAFSSGLPTAKMLVPYMSPSFDDVDLIHFNRFQAAMFMKHNSEQLPAFTIETKKLPISNPDAEQRIRALSNENYTPMTRKQVLGWLKKQYPRPTRRPGQGSDLGGNDDFREEKS